MAWRKALQQVRTLLQQRGYARLSVDDRLQQQPALLYEVDRAALVSECVVAVLRFVEARLQLGELIVKEAQHLRGLTGLQTNVALHIAAYDRVDRIGGSRAIGPVQPDPDNARLFDLLAYIKVLL